MRIKLPHKPSSLFTAAALVAACSVINAPDDVVTAAGGATSGKGGSTSGKGGSTSGKGGDTNGGQGTGTAGEGPGGAVANGGAAAEPGTGGAAAQPGTGGEAGAPGPGCVSEVLYEADFTANDPVQVGGVFNNTNSSFDLNDDNLTCAGNFVTCNGLSQQDRAANSANKVVLRFVFTIGDVPNSFTVNFNASSDNGVELALSATGLALYANNDQIGVFTSFGGSHDATAVNYAELIYENAHVTATVASGDFASAGGVVDGTVSGDLLLADFPAFSNIDVQAFHEANNLPLYIDDLTLTEEVCN